MYNIGLIRVVSIFEEEFLNTHGKIIEKNFTDIKVESLAIEDQPEGIHDDETEKIAIPKIVNLAKKNFSNKDAIIISCAGDPALEILREEMDVPVIGAGESAALLSKIYGEKVGIVGITKNLPKSYIKILPSSEPASTLVPSLFNATPLIVSLNNENSFNVFPLSILYTLTVLS